MNAVNFSTQLEEIRDLLCNDTTGVAAPDVSFWGSRLIVKGTSCVYLEDIACKVQDIAIACENERVLLSPAQRIAGLQIVQKLQGFYEETDKQAANANCFTRFLVWLREWTLWPYAIRFYIEDGIEGDRFRTYTRVAFMNLGTAEERRPYASEEGTFPPKIKVDEAFLRNLLRV
jgi:hypothetical protein